MGTSPLPVDVIRSTIESLEECVKRLETERSAINTKLDQLTTNIEALEAQLAATESQGTRRRKGENLEQVRAVLFSGRGMTASAIAAEMGTASTSVQAVLKKHNQEFYQDAGGLWRRKAEAA